MNGRDIPGYYFDVEKNKYFRILPGHVAPQGSRYTHAQIEATEAQQKRDREQLIRDNQLRTQRVRRARALDTSCYVSPTLVRETDVPSRSSRAFRFRTFASGLHRVRLIRSEVKEITALARVDTPGSLFGTGTKHCNGSRSADQKALPNQLVHCYDSEKENPRKRMLEQRHQQSPISSVSWAPDTPHSSACVTTLGSYNSAMVGMIELHTDITIQTMEGVPQMQIRTGPGFRCQPGTSAFCSAFNPFHGPESSKRYFAFGTSDGAGYFCEHDVQGTKQFSKTSSNVLSIDWQTVDVIAQGHRNGTVQLWDTRHNGTSLRLKHPSSINKIKRVDEHKLVVAGIEHALNMYDLRMPAKESQMKAKKRRAPGASLPTSWTSDPVIEYTYRNSHSSGLGLDISHATGTLAAADATGLINIFSLTTPELYNSFDPYESLGRPNPDIRNLIRNIVYHGPPDDEIMTFSCGGDLFRTEWGPETDDG